MEIDILFDALERQVSWLTEMAEAHLSSARRFSGYGDSRESYRYIYLADGAMDFVKKMANDKLIQISEGHRQKMDSWEARLNIIIDELHALLIS